MNASNIFRPYRSKESEKTIVPTSAPTASNDTTSDPSAMVKGPLGSGDGSWVSKRKLGPHQPHDVPAENESKLPANHTATIQITIRSQVF